MTVITPEDHESAGPPPAGDDRHARFPWGPLRDVAALILIHLGIVLAAVGPQPDTARFVRLGGLVAGRLAWEEPWRFLTSLLLHSGPSHLFWNGMSMIVFAVPLILDFGYVTTAVIYLAAGVLGGLAGVMAVPDGVVLIGSSGAVAGLFGAWLSITLLRARAAPLPRRSRIRVLGVALLVLPSLVTPTTSSGEPVSVGAHLGGLAAGLAAGVILWHLGYVTVPVRRPEWPTEDDEEDEGGGRYEVH